MKTRCSSLSSSPINSRFCSSTACVRCNAEGWLPHAMHVTDCHTIKHARGMWDAFTSVGCEATVLQLLLQPLHLCAEKWIHYLWLYQLLGVETKPICIIRFQLKSLLFPHIVCRRLWKWLFSTYVTCAKWHLGEQSQTWACIESPETDCKKKKTFGEAVRRAYCSLTGF